VRQALMKKSLESGSRNWGSLFQHLRVMFMKLEAVYWAGTFSAVRLSAHGPHRVFWYVKLKKNVRLCVQHMRVMFMKLEAVYWAGAFSVVSLSAEVAVSCVICNTWDGIEDDYSRVGVAVGYAKHERQVRLFSPYLNLLELLIA
jgi:hypothetical protein